MIFMYAYSTTLTLSIKIKPLFYISFETACKILSCLILIPNDNVLCYFLSFLASVLSIDRRLSKLTPKGYLGIYISISCYNFFLRLVKISQACSFPPADSRGGSNHWLDSFLSRANSTHPQKETLVAHSDIIVKYTPPPQSTTKCPTFGMCVREQGIENVTFQKCIYINQGTLQSEMMSNFHFLLILSGEI